jgi:hypothetical protein
MFKVRRLEVKLQFSLLLPYSGYQIDFSHRHNCFDRTNDFRKTPLEVVDRLHHITTFSLLPSDFFNLIFQQRASQKKSQSFLALLRRHISHDAPVPRFIP